MRDGAADEGADVGFCAVVEDPAVELVVVEELMVVVDADAAFEARLKGPMMHCFISLLSVQVSPDLDGVKVRSYVESNPPAAQPTKPTKTSSFLAISSFCSQNLVMHFIWSALS